MHDTGVGDLVSRVLGVALGILVYGGMIGFFVGGWLILVRVAWRIGRWLWGYDD